MEKLTNDCIYALKNKPQDQNYLDAFRDFLSQRCGVDYSEKSGNDLYPVAVEMFLDYIKSSFMAAYDIANYFHALEHIRYSYTDAILAALAQTVIFDAEGQRTNGFWYDDEEDTEAENE